MGTVAGAVAGGDVRISLKSVPTGACVPPVTVITTSHVPATFAVAVSGSVGPPQP